MDMLAWKDEPIGKLANRAVAEDMFPFHEGLGLGLTWIRSEGSGETDTLKLEPPFPGNRPSWAVDADARPRAYLADHSWGVIDGRVEQGRENLGIVDLRVGVHVRFYVERGLSKPFPTGEFESRDGFLSWANEHRLPGGDRCFRLRTIAGDLWIKGSEGEPLERQLSEKNPPLFVDHRVLHLPNFYHSRNIRSPLSISGPWSGLQTTDNDGRLWVIRDSPLTFTAACELHVAGRSNNKLANRELTVLQPPYQCVWAQDGLSGQMPSFTAS